MVSRLVFLLATSLAFAQEGPVVYRSNSVQGGYLHWMDTHHVTWQMSLTEVNPNQYYRGSFDFDVPVVPTFFDAWGIGASTAIGFRPWSRINPLHYGVILQATYFTSPKSRLGTKIAPMLYWRFMDGDTFLPLGIEAAWLKDYVAVQIQYNFWLRSYRMNPA